MMRALHRFLPPRNHGTATHFFLFHSAFWLTSGFLLFLSGLSQGPVNVSITRNLYYTITGFLLGSALAYFFQNWQGGVANKRRLFVGLSASLILGTLSTLPINPITFGQLGTGWHQLTVSHWFAGSLNYSLVLMVWTLLYLYLTSRNAEPAASSDKHQDVADSEAPSQPLKRQSGRISAWQGSKEISLPVDQVLYIQAAGDYVELHTTDLCLLKRATMNFMATRLQPFGFIRIHRSILLNANKVLTVEALSKGSYRFRLEDNRFVQSSRSFARDIRLAFFDQP